LELLSQENDLLVEQQGELEAEVSRAQGQLTLTTAESEAPAPAVENFLRGLRFGKLQAFYASRQRKMEEVQFGVFKMKGVCERSDFLCSDGCTKAAQGPNGSSVWCLYGWEIVTGTAVTEILSAVVCGRT
jgi:hypothetical protein